MSESSYLAKKSDHGLGVINQRKGAQALQDNRAVPAQHNFNNPAQLKADAVPLNTPGAGVVQLGKKKQAVKVAKANNPNGVQHHVRPEYQKQNEEAHRLVLQGVDRKEAARQAKINVPVKKK